MTMADQAEQTSHHAEVEIINQRGLHARAAVKLAKSIEDFEATIHIGYKDCMQVDAREIIELMMLGAAQGSRLVIETSGPDAAAALETICNLIAARFDEEI